MKTTKMLPRAALHDELLGMMRDRAKDEAREEIRRVVGAALGGGPIVYRAMIHGSVIVRQDKNGPGIDITENVITDRNDDWAPFVLPRGRIITVGKGGNHKTIKAGLKALRRPRRSAASLAKQARSMKRVWAAKRKAGKGKK